MMSQGTSGEQHGMDHGRPKNDTTIDACADAIAAEAADACARMVFPRGATRAMAESRLTLRRRVPDEPR
jgi:hypothetical protein